MISKRSIICFSNDWRSDPTSKHQIMKLLAHNNMVLWVNSIGLRSPKLKKHDIKRMFYKVKSFLKGLEKINENLYVFTPIVIPFHDLKLTKIINSYIFKKSIKHFIKKLSMKNIIFWSYLPNVSYIIEHIDPDLIIYHCVDEWSKFSFIDENIVYEERALCEMSNLVLTSAKALYASKRPYNPNTYYIPHGVDYKYFHNGKSNNLPIPYDMINISKPIAGFFGLIHEWVDLELLDYIVRNNRDVNFVFIGKYLTDISALNKNPNIYFLGQKTYDELINYAKHFDIGLIPFKVNELTINVNPIKLKEYFALGIPVISVNLPEVYEYNNVVRIADDYQAFDQALKEEISGRHKASIEEINRIAMDETWERKVDEISDLIMNIEGAN